MTDKAIEAAAGEIFDEGVRQDLYHGSDWEAFLDGYRAGAEAAEAELKFTKARLKKWASGELTHADHTKERDALWARVEMLERTTQYLESW